MDEVGMNSSFSKTLLRASSVIHAGGGVKAKVRQVRFLCRAWCARKYLQSGLQRGGEFFLETVKLRPEVLGVIEWPYIHAQWSMEERFNSLVEHHRLVTSFPLLMIPVGLRRDLCALDDIESGLSIVLDRPQWFLREGEVSLNLFLGDVRLYTIAFNLERTPSGAVGVAVGGIQGRSIDNAKDTYAQLTKAMHGVRPRDFLISVLSLLCEEFGIESARGISDDFRHHRSDYFGVGGKTTSSADYDGIWLDRSGALEADGFFHFVPKLVERPLEDVPSKKRAMYRRRGEFYERLRAEVRRAIAQNPPLQPQLPG